MIVESRAVGPFFKNGFVVGCEATREAVLIDPGDEVADLLAIAGVRTLTITSILLTHAHFDHVTGVAAARRALGVPIYLHQDDLFLYEKAVDQGAMFGIEVEPQPPIDRFYTPGQTIRFGELEARVHHTPGHCPGGVCLEVARVGENGQGSLRRRHAVRRLDRPYRPAGWRLRHAPPLDPARPLRVPGRRDRVSGTRREHHDRPRAAD